LVEYKKKETQARKRNDGHEQMEKRHIFGKKVIGFFPTLRKQSTTQEHSHSKERIHDHTDD